MSNVGDDGNDALHTFFGSPALKWLEYVYQVGIYCHEQIRLCLVY